MKSIYRLLLLSIVFNSGIAEAQAQGKSKNDGVYIDAAGVMRWKSSKAEVALFGVNYTTPFAYAYRAHKAVNADLETAIRQDVYHMARLGFDAFRVHVWDNEISDVQGNLLENDHLRLFDFLLSELKKRGIKTIVTPIAFWGNGYPERDENVPGFSQYFGRGKLTTNDSAIAAQENYLKQFFRHVNPYTKLSYQDDPDVIAMEINNEPAHSGPKPPVTRYINRLAAAVKSTGWTKPVFYNISQGPWYADAVAASVADGFSFQWYPAGLVSNNTLDGNYLPHVDKYTIPFDTIPAFRKKPKMVYEFDAADILDSYMYPAMAKSFREAGFQWATQFAYDPMAIAHANTEYQTHYLNLAYTPSKAISMLIASRVFHRIARNQDSGVYPADSVFDAFRLSYRKALSEMNTAAEFYHSNATTTRPVDINALTHVAGVGNSPVVQYTGTGAYFLDKLEPGVWRLEVMPDAVFIRDPFERASPRKEVTRVIWASNDIAIRIPDLANGFAVKGLNAGNSFTTSATGTFKISPGTYMLTAQGKKASGKVNAVGTLRLEEFAAPRPIDNSLFLSHEPLNEVSSGKPLEITATIVGLDSGTVSLHINRLYGPFRNIPMKKVAPYRFIAEVPAELVAPGQLSYRIVVRTGNAVTVFPGNLKEDPFAWDNFNTEAWKTFVAGETTSISLYDPTEDRALRTYPVFRRGFQTSFIAGNLPGQLVLRMSGNDFKGVPAMGFQFAFVDKVKGRKQELAAADRVVIRARAAEGERQAKIVIMFADASSIAGTVTLSPEFKDIEIPIARMTAGEAMLLPRPYPGFLPLTFKGPQGKPVLTDAERIEVTLDTGGVDAGKPMSLEVEGIWLKKAP